jgi:glycosyltransferase involved in cell wall biosynthesis
VGGALEGVNPGETGFATPAKDAAAIATALIRILKDDAMAQSMAAAARVFVLEHFDLAKCTARLERYYDEVSAGVS